jgi:hypothetical protein
VEDGISTNTSGNIGQQHGTAGQPPAANENRVLSTARVSRSISSPKAPLETLVPIAFGTEPPVRNHQHLEGALHLPHLP